MTAFVPNPAMAALSRKLVDVDNDTAIACLCALRVLATIEAVAAQRIENDQTALSKLTKIRDDARHAIERITGSRDNPFYPQKEQRP